MIAVAALSARALVDAAVLDGERCVALDAFGDVDTRRAAVRWHDIGAAGAPAVDGGRLVRTLHALAREGRVTAWLAGSGFEHQPEVLAEGAQALPLLGTAGDDVRRLRDPRAFFAWLADEGLPHPPVAFERPEGAGWLRKDFGGAGGLHVRREPAADASGLRTYWQCERTAAQPMSATFVATGRDAALLGFNRQRTVALGERPFVFEGVVGPVPVAEAVRRVIAQAARRAAAQYTLRGLGSVDFLLHHGAPEILEINARPPASLALYPRIGAAGPLRAHRQACNVGELPPPVAPGPVRGTAIVFARRPLAIGAGLCARLAALPQTHDLPLAGAVFAPGEPVCSVSAAGDDEDDVHRQLDTRREALHTLLETSA